MDCISRYYKCNTRLTCTYNWNEHLLTKSSNNFGVSCRLLGTVWQTDTFYMRFLDIKIITTQHYS